MKEISITEVLGVKEYERFDIVNGGPKVGAPTKVICKNAYVDSSDNICGSTGEVIDGETICQLLTQRLQIIKSPKITPDEAELFSRAGVKFITRGYEYSCHELRLWDKEPKGDFGHYEPYSWTRMLGSLPAAALPNIHPGECIAVDDWNKA